MLVFENWRAWNRKAILQFRKNFFKGVPANSLAVLDHAEKNDAGVRIKKHQEEHGHNDKETAEHGHEYGQHEHFQCRLKSKILMRYTTER